MNQGELYTKLANLACPAGYSVRKGKNPYVVFCNRFDDQQNQIQVAVYFSEKAHRGFTVATAINHPKSGKTQLFRKGCSWGEVTELLKNPRKHTGKGYYER